MCHSYSIVDHAATPNAINAYPSTYALSSCPRFPIFKIFKSQKYVLYTTKETLLSYPNLANTVSHYKPPKIFFPSKILLFLLPISSPSSFCPLKLGSRLFFSRLSVCAMKPPLLPSLSSWPFKMLFVSWLSAMLCALLSLCAGVIIKDAGKVCERPGDGSEYTLLDALVERASPVTLEAKDRRGLRSLSERRVSVGLVPNVLLASLFSYELSLLAGANNMLLLASSRSRLCCAVLGRCLLNLLPIMAPVWDISARMTSFLSARARSRLDQVLLRYSIMGRRKTKS